jgi:6-phosphogluconate dehydrogenase
MLSPGDIICDCGNEHFEVTNRREVEARAHDIVWMGVGVSGGEEGARYGPAMMVGGVKKGYERYGRSDHFFF